MRFAQNFLRDPFLAASLVQQSSLAGNSLILEIGPGEGVFTVPLSKIARRVIAVEIDRRLVRILTRRFPPHHGNVTIIGMDFMRFRLPSEPCKVFSSVPFNQTAAILQRLLSAPQITEAWLILQRQAAWKYAGIPHETEASVLTQMHWQSCIVHEFQSKDFEPAPAVPTVLLKLQKREKPPVPPDDETRFRQFVRHGFRTTKPNLRLAYKKIFTYPQWLRLSRELEFVRDATPSQLSFAQWLKLHAYFKQGVAPNKQRRL
jgi:23S rRNA (adenine-N6)-dimethyltransferase